jgi:hypothetical protein
MKHLILSITILTVIYAYYDYYSTGQAVLALAGSEHVR